MLTHDLPGAHPLIDAYPPLPLEEWRATYETLHMWTQIVGKVRLHQSSPINHWWHCTLYVTARGLTTSLMPYGQKGFQIDFDFIDHQLLIVASDGTRKAMELRPRSVADFYRELMGILGDMGMPVEIHAVPDEVPVSIPFAEDETHKSYDAEYANRWWRIMVQSDRVFKQFRSGFIGKCSPVHFFWGGFDLAVTRFSGKRAPVDPNANVLNREGYSHEVISCGFWPGSGAIQSPAYYAYCVPKPDGLEDHPIHPGRAFFSKESGLFFLLYDEVQKAGSPDATIMEFLQSTYDASAHLAGWNRAELEREKGSEQL